MEILRGNPRHRRRPSLTGCDISRSAWAGRSHIAAKNRRPSPTLAELMHLLAELTNLNRRRTEHSSSARNQLIKFRSFPLAVNGAVRAIGRGMTMALTFGRYAVYLLPGRYRETVTRAGRARGSLIPMGRPQAVCHAPRQHPAACSREPVRSLPPNAHRSTICRVYGISTGGTL